MIVGILLLSLISYMSIFLDNKDIAYSKKHMEQDVVIHAYISRVNKTKLELEDATIGNTIFKRAILTSVKNNNYKVGQKIEARCRVVDFEDARNRGNFDERNYFNSRGIFLKLKNIKVNKFYFESVFTRNINKIRESIVGKLSNNKAGSVYKAILLGIPLDDYEIKDGFSATGISHILVVSGLHMSFIASILIYILRKFGTSYISNILIFNIVMLIYLLIIGVGTSSFRAFIMYVIYLAAFICKRTYDSLTAMSVVGIWWLILIPSSIYSLSFILSYTMIVVLYVVNKIKIWNKFFNLMLRLVGIYIISFPVIAKLFYIVPLYSVIANLLVLPLMPIILILGISGTVLSFLSIALGSFILKIGEVFIAWIIYLADFIKTLPYAQLIVGDVNFILIIIFYMILYIIYRLYVSKKRIKTLLPAILLPILFFIKIPPNLEINFLD